MKACQQMFAKDLDEGELKFWRDFMGGYSIAELRFAFENWQRNGRFFPKPKDIAEQCEAYRVGEVSKHIPIGCERCDWTGFYQVRQEGVERFVAECPCRTNVGLRTRCTKQKAAREELALMWSQLKKFEAGKTMEPKPKQISGIIPTTAELAQQLAKAKRV